MRNRLDRLTERLSRKVENLVLFDVADSTHALARRIIAEMDDESQKLGSTLILADRQTSGEGRGNRSWESPTGGLYLSWLRSGITSGTILQLPMLAAVAAYDAIIRVGVDDARIKWPNDILVTGRKIAGIIVFVRRGGPNWVTIGLGVNLENVPDLDEVRGPEATAVAEHVTGGDADVWRHEAICAFIDKIDLHMENPGPAINRWRELLIQRPGDAIAVRLASGKEASGTLIEVTEEGFLKIRENGEETVITGGDVIEI